MSDYFKRIGRVVGALTVLVAGVALRAAPSVAQDLSRLGGDLTSDLPLFTALELPAPNIRSEEMFTFHLLGHGDFHGSFFDTRKNGKRVLGPLFNHNSCGACHVKDGRGPVRFGDEFTGSPILVKVALKGLNKDGSPRDVPGIGEQIRDHAFGKRTDYRLLLRWKLLSGQYPDGSKYTLRRPNLSFDLPKIDEKRVVHSLRMTPPVIGMGLLEAVPEQDLIAMSDPNDENRDGISGKVAYVPEKGTGNRVVGRFGFRASNPSIKQQSAAAFFNDMGVTTSLFNDGKAEPEVDDQQLDRLVFYQQAAGVTPARDQDDPAISQGKLLFQQVGCDSCHKMTLTTGDSDVVEVANQEFHPFTDLLLHDMGPDLADKRKEFSASGRDWRTTPLWGLGLVSTLLTEGRTGFLHDGRARTIEEAILWHGGEARRSRNKFKQLSRLERSQLIRFLGSL